MGRGEQKVILPGGRRQCEEGGAVAAMGEEGHGWGGEAESEVKVAQSCPPLWPHGLHSPWNSPGQNTGVSSLSLLQGIFPTQGSSPDLPHCRQIFHQLSHKRNPRILEWIAYLFSKGSSWPRNQTGVSCIAGGCLTHYAIREAQKSGGLMPVWLCD